MTKPRRGWRRTRKPAAPKPALTGMWHLRELYLDALRVRNYSNDTLRTGGHCLRRFLVWCDERSLTEPTEITQPIIERFQRWLFYYRQANGRPLTVAVQAQTLRRVRLFFKWLTRQHVTLFNPAAEIELPRYPVRLPRDILTAQEVEAILAEPDVQTPLGVRDRAILETFYATGIRRKELAGLSVYDLDPARGALLIREGKGGKDRFLPIGQRARDWINRYLVDVRPQLVLEPDEGYMFVTVDGAALQTRHVLGDLVKKYIRAAGIKKTGACHIFRHTMATLMLENGADIRYIQEMLGHAVLSTTQIYTHVSIAKLRQIYEATHPAEAGRARASHGDAAPDPKALDQLLADDDDDAGDPRAGPGEGHEA